MRRYVHDTAEECLAAECGTCATNPPLPPRSDEVPRMRTVGDQAQVLRFALGWMLEAYERAEDDGAEMTAAQDRAYVFGCTVFDATNPYVKAAV